MYPLFGGDVLGIVDLVESILKKMRFGMYEKPKYETSDLIMEVVGKLLRSCSGLLDSKAFPAWRDLGHDLRLTSVLRFEAAVEALGAAIPAITALPVPEGITITAQNLCEYPVSSGNLAFTVHSE